MRRWVRRGVIPLALVGATGCGETGPTAVDFELAVAGTRADAVEALDGWQLTLSRADVAFGPLYLCPGVTAGDLCDTARAEWTEAVVVRALDPTPRSAGTLVGSTGPVRSWMYDHGIVSLLTQQDPVALDAAFELGGYSVVLEGEARRDDSLVTFEARLEIRQQEETEIGVPVVRKSASDVFDHEITEGETQLLVRFDPATWVEDIDFTPLADDGVDSVSFEPDSQGYRAITNAVIAGERPIFTWAPPTSTED